MPMNTNTNYPDWVSHLRAVFDFVGAGSAGIDQTLATLPDDYDWQSALHRVHAAILPDGPVSDIHRRAASGEPVAEQEWVKARCAIEQSADALDTPEWWSASWQEIPEAIARSVQRIGKMDRDKYSEIMLCVAEAMRRAGRRSPERHSPAAFHQR